MFYPIFTAPMAAFNDRGSYEFIAEFADPELAGRYLRYMRSKRRYAGKDIIVIKAQSPVPEPNGFQDCVCAVSGEYIVLGNQIIS